MATRWRHTTITTAPLLLLALALLLLLPMAARAFRPAAGARGGSLLSQHRPRRPLVTVGSIKSTHQPSIDSIHSP